MNQSISKIIPIGILLLNICYAPIIFLGVYHSVPNFLLYTFIIGCILSFVILAPMVFISLKLRTYVFFSIVVGMAASFVPKIEVGYIYAVLFPFLGLTFLASKTFQFRKSTIYQYAFICITISMFWLYLYGSISNYIFMFLYKLYLHEKLFWPYKNGSMIFNAMVVLANVSLLSIVSSLILSFGFKKSANG